VPVGGPKDRRTFVPRYLRRRDAKMYAGRHARSLVSLDIYGHTRPAATFFSCQIDGANSCARRCVFS
jgi:hypothetical protein